MKVLLSLIVSLLLMVKDFLKSGGRYLYSVPLHTPKM